METIIDSFSCVSTKIVWVATTGSVLVPAVTAVRYSEEASDTEKIMTSYFSGKLYQHK
jgi:hypothetical protein